MAKQVILVQKPARITNGKLLNDQPLLDRGMNFDECRSICTSPEIPVREKLVSLHAWLCMKLAKGITTMQVCPGNYLWLAARHTMQVKERYYEKVGEDFEQVHENCSRFHPAFVENW